jgi:hypothetical protein
VARSCGLYPALRALPIDPQPRRSHSRIHACIHCTAARLACLRHCDRPPRIAWPTQQLRTLTASSCALAIPSSTLGQLSSRLFPGRHAHSRCRHHHAYAYEPGQTPGRNPRLSTPPHLGLRNFCIQRQRCKTLPRRSPPCSVPQDRAVHVSLPHPAGHTAPLTRHLLLALTCLLQYSYLTITWNATSTARYHEFYTN